MSSSDAPLPASSGLLTGVTGDLRHAFRLLWKGKGMTAITLLTLALCIGAAALLNARLVMRLGMRRLNNVSAWSLAVLSSVFLLVALLHGGHPPLVVTMAWMYPAFLCIGMLFSNVHAQAMEPLGHIAGIGAALVGAGSSVLAIPFGVLIGQLYDGTVLPLAGGFAVLSTLCGLVMRWAGRRPAG